MKLSALVAFTMALGTYAAALPVREPSGRLALRVLRPHPIRNLLKEIESANIALSLRSVRPPLSAPTTWLSVTRFRSCKRAKLLAILHAPSPEKSNTKSPQPDQEAQLRPLPFWTPTFYPAPSITHKHDHVTFEVGAIGRYDHNMVRAAKRGIVGPKEGLSLTRGCLLRNCLTSFDRHAHIAYQGLLVFTIRAVY